MKRMPNDDFLKPLKNRPGLQPRLEFKKELATKLLSINSKKRPIEMFKIPILVGMAFLLLFIIFSGEISENLKGEQTQMGHSGPNKEPNNHAIPDENKDYISEEEALTISKKYEQDEKVTWVAQFERDSKELEEFGLESKPFWKVEGTYPLGNKMIIYLDGVTGDYLNMSEIESPGFGEVKINLFESVEVIDNLDPVSKVYKGKIKFLLSDAAKNNWIKNSTLSVTVSGETMSISSDPLIITDLSKPIELSFEFDLDSEKLTHKLIGNVYVFIYQKDPANYLINHQEVKKIVVE